MYPRLKYCRTIVLLDKLKLLKKPLFQKQRWSCDFPPRKTLVAQKHSAISHQEKMVLSSPRRVALGRPFPSPRVCTYVCTYIRTDGRTLKSEPKFLASTDYQLTHGALQRVLAHGSSATDFFTSCVTGDIMLDECGKPISRQIHK